MKKEKQLSEGFSFISFLSTDEFSNISDEFYEAHLEHGKLYKFFISLFLDSQLHSSQRKTLIQYLGLLQTTNISIKNVLK